MDSVTYGALLPDRSISRDALGAWHADRLPSPGAANLPPATATPRDGHADRVPVAGSAQPAHCLSRQIALRRTGGHIISYKQGKVLFPVLNDCTATARR